MVHIQGRHRPYTTHFFRLGTSSTQLIFKKYKTVSPFYTLLKEIKELHTKEVLKDKLIKTLRKKGRKKEQKRNRRRCGTI